MHRESGPKVKTLKACKREFIKVQLLLAYYEVSDLKLKCFEIKTNEQPGGIHPPDSVFGSVYFNEIQPSFGCLPAFDGCTDKMRS